MITSYRISTVGKVKTFPINVYEQRIIKFSRENALRFQLRIKDVGDCFKIRGFFIPHHLIDAKSSVLIEIGGQYISEIPLSLLVKLNTRTDIQDYIEFNYDIFFSEPIYLNLLQYHEVWLRFKNIHIAINEINVVFDATWLEESERKVNKKTTLMKQVEPKPCGIIQNILVCDKKSNIAGIEVKADTHNVLNYDDIMVGIYGVDINDGVTCFNMNPLQDWKSHGPNGGFHEYAHNKTDFVIKQKEERACDVYYLVTNQLNYGNGMVSRNFSWA
jgi:hypothetical protein